MLSDCMFLSYFLASRTRQSFSIGLFYKRMCQVATTGLSIGIERRCCRRRLYLLKAARIFGNRHLSWKSLHAGCAEEACNSPGTRQHIGGVLRFRNWATMT